MLSWPTTATDGSFRGSSVCKLVVAEFRMGGDCAGEWAGSDGPFSCGLSSPDVDVGTTGKTVGLAMTVS